MSRRSGTLSALLGAALLGVLGFAGVLGLRAIRPQLRHASASVSAPAPAPAMRTFTAPRQSVAQSTLDARQVTIAFAVSYGAYLDGAPRRVLRFSSITATSQATGGGRIPVNFRDGALELTRVQIQAGAYSAQATLVIGDRQESYPFSVTLLREQHGWQVASLVPADLSMDRHITAASTPTLARAAQAATRQLVLGYARYRAGDGTAPAGLSGAAMAAIKSNSDSLAGVVLGKRAPRLLRLVYGPLSGGNEFAATATVAFGDGRQQFSVLMKQQKRTGEWLCAAFL
jgi:hypothetical protein